MSLKNVNRLIHSIRFRLALSFSILLFGSALVLLISGYAILRINLDQGISTEMANWSAQLEKSVLMRESPDDDETVLSVNEIPGKIRETLDSAFPSIIILTGKKSSARHSERYEIKGVHGNSILEIEIDAQGRITETKKKNKVAVFTGLIANFRKSVIRKGNIELTSALFDRDGKLLFVSPSSADGAAYLKKAFDHPGHRIIKDSRRTLFRVERLSLPDKSVLLLFRSMNDVNLIACNYLISFTVVFIIVFALSIFFSWVLSGRATRGIHVVSEAARELGEGNFGKRVVPPNDGYEVCSLADSFNTMASRIQALLEEQKEMTDNIAHDLRTPITRIKGVVEITPVPEPVPEVLQQMISIVVEECDNLIHMINNTLEISQAETGLLHLTMTEFDLGEVIRKAHQLFLPLAENRKVNFQLIVPERKATLFRGDKSRIQRIVANLLDNAIKYASKGGHISLSLLEDDHAVKVGVQDTGCGISPEKLPHIFERFYRGDNSRSLPGNGLGLTLAQAFAKAHNGSIAVSSIPGKGSNFVLILPVGTDRA